MKTIAEIRREKILDTVQGFSGKFMTRRAFIEKAISDGWRVRHYPNSREFPVRFESPEGNFYSPRDITKIAFEYAKELGCRHETE